MGREVVERGIQSVLRRIGAENTSMFAASEPEG